MAELIWRDVHLWVAAYDLTTRTNSLAINYSADLVDITHFTDTTRRRLGGLRSVEISYAGYYDDVPDQAGAPLIGVSGTALTVSPTTPTDGTLSYFASGVVGQLRLGADIGDALGIDAKLSGSAPLVRGLIAASKSTRTASGNGTAYQLGAVSQGQGIYAALHVFAMSGTSPTVTVIIESDDNQAMSSPVTRINFGSKNAVGGWFASSTTATTDTWWRASWTITGTSPQITFAVVFGIQ